MLSRLANHQEPQSEQPTKTILGTGAKTGSRPDPLHILVLTFTYPPNKDGVAEAARSMAEGLAERGFKVTVATGFLPERTVADGAGLEVRQFKVTGTSELGRGFSGEVEAYQKWVEGFTGDMVVAHSWDAWTTDLARSCFPKLRARKILISHGFGTHIPPWRPKFPWGLGVWLRWQHYVWRLPWMLRDFDHVIFLSQTRDLGRFFDHLVAHWTGYRRISVIPNTAHVPTTDETLRFRAKHGLGDALIFLCVANYSTRKNQELALRAFRAASLANAVLVFIGSEFNEYSNKLRQIEARCSAGETCGKVILLEKVTRAETAAAFHECDVFVLSAKAETQPFVLIEAMACRKPFISTDTGCCRELPGGTIARSEKEFGWEMARLAASPEERRALGEKGYAAFLQDYTPQRALDAYERLIRALVEPDTRADVP